MLLLNRTKKECAMEMQNSAGQKLHRCAECKGRGTWLVCSKIKERKPTKKDARTSFLDQRKYPFAIRMRSLLETHGYT